MGYPIMIPSKTGPGADVIIRPGAAMSRANAYALPIIMSSSVNTYSIEKRKFTTLIPSKNATYL